ncbi:PapD-like protein [Baffinella frigidus]|nr:PapD-like protein [Cryptophyta sp. CCMP2293]
MNNLLEVLPSNEIKFELVVGKTLERVLRLKNNNDTAVAFKVKTTAPKRYCVRPNCSVVQPGESVEVTIVMQPLKELPPSNQAVKDKFLIQGAKVLNGLAAASGDPKAVFDDVDKESIVDQKLTCAFEYPRNATDRPLAPVLEVASPLKPGAANTSGESFSPAVGGKGDDLGGQLVSEKRLSEKLARDLRDAKDRAAALERELSDERANNRDTLRALEEVQAKFVQLQAKSKSGGEKGGAEAGGVVAEKIAASPLNNMLLLVLVTLVCLLAMRVFMPQ